MESEHTGDVESMMAQRWVGVVDGGNVTSQQIQTLRPNANIGQNKLCMICRRTVPLVPNTSKHWVSIKCKKYR